MASWLTSRLAVWKPLLRTGRLFSRNDPPPERWCHSCHKTLDAGLGNTAVIVDGRRYCLKCFLESKHER